LKYRGVPQLLEKLFESAEALSGRIDLPRPLLDRLFARTRIKTMPRAQWERQIRSAFAVDHITKDLLPASIERARRWFGDAIKLDERSVEQAKGVLQTMDSTKGLLVVTFHGGFSRMALVLYQHLFEDGVIVLGGKSARKDRPANDKYIVVWQNERTALFQALRALQDRKTLWIGGDAPFGNRAVSIDMLGSPLPVPDGPSFLAYETGCNTAWLSYVREGRGMAPVLVAGPVREGKEKYKEYKTRWLKFYAERIDEFLTGDPRNIALRPHLIEVLNKPPTPVLVEP
jgi:lauroyl/myristoyl acyltransferase